MFFIGLLAAMVTPEVDGMTRSLLVGELFIISLCWFGLLAWGLSTPIAPSACCCRCSDPLNLVTGVLFAVVSLAILASTGRAGGLTSERMGLYCNKVYLSGPEACVAP